ncbi:hypothetical protein H6P81_018396 [Aristolochia fimbriata]|uniref:Dolichyl-diphosphooligosaccharide--protein glycosyltransferase subunit 1 n=1 Tax=Aristolochia fimbriata TaxID=158543 RepID=A0AAV7E551_ARIFI|nr:hypothetical protein H6P81_018396 [Aristolochia fimbriata]
MAFRFACMHFLFFSIAIFWSSASADLVLSKVDRRIDLTSHIVRVSSSIKVENAGSAKVSELLLAVPDFQAKHLAYLSASNNEGKGKTKRSSSPLPIEIVQADGMPPNLTFYSVSLPKELEKGDNLLLDVFSVFTHLLQPFPEEITQADIQLLLFQDSALYLSPYEVKFQSLTVTVPSPRVESFTKLPNSKIVDKEIKYGPYENVPSFSYNPIIIHFENNQPFVVAQELVREIEISHWGNIQITENYNLIHGGAHLKGGFSRFEYQTRGRGVSSFRYLNVRLPPRAHSVYYRDHIGNISTSHLWGDSRKTELEIEPRYPMFGGWHTSFTIGYGLPLQDFLFQSEGKRFINFSFGCPMDEVVIDNLIVKVALPEGSKDISVSVPFPTKQWQEVKYSHLDVTGRPVVVLQKNNVIPEYNQYFQVYYKFNSLALLQEPCMLIVGFFLLFVTCIVYMHTDLSISRSTPSYLAKLQLEEVQATVQQIQKIIYQCLSIHDKLDASLQEMPRTGDVQTCKAVRKAADASFKEHVKELTTLLGFLQSSPQATSIWPKVAELVSKEKEMQEKLMLKHTTIVDSYEKKSSGRDIENRVAGIQQKLTSLRQDVDDLLDFLDNI